MKHSVTGSDQMRLLQPVLSHSLICTYYSINAHMWIPGGRVQGGQRREGRSWAPAAFVARLVNTIKQLAKEEVGTARVVQ